MSVDVATKRALESPPPQKPVYGTPEDFSRAIEERVICERCGDDRTGPVEGTWVSPSAHHSGMRALLYLSK